MDYYRARLRRIDLGLRDSFSKIKEEINEIKSNLDLHAGTLKETKKEFEESKKDFVGVDKINVLKINIGELREELKAVERLEKKLKEIESKAADSEMTKESIEELKSQVDAVERTGNSAAPDAKVEKLIKEINGEFAGMRETIREIEGKGGSIVKDKFEKLEHDVNKKITGIGNRLHLLGEEIKKMPTKQEINQLLRDINGEFDNVKEQLDDVKMLRNDLKTVRREKLGKPYFEQQLQRLEDEMNGMKSQLGSLKKTRFERNAKTGKRKFNWYLFANIFITLAFVLLGASLVLFFLEKEGFMDYLIYASIGSFVIGVLTRIIVVIKG